MVGKVLNRVYVFPIKVPYMLKKELIILTDKGSSVLQHHTHCVLFYCFFIAKKYNASKIANVQPQGEPGSKANYPLTERQQLQYLLEVTAKEVRQDFESSNCDDLPSNSSKTKKRNIAKDNQIEARIRKRNERGETSLHVAAIKGDLEDVVALIKAGAVVNAKDNAGKKKMCRRRLLTLSLSSLLLFPWSEKGNG